MVPADRQRVNQAREDGSFFENEAFRWAMQGAKRDGTRLHLLGIVSFLLATNSEMKLLPPLEMLFMTIQNTIAVGLFVGMLIGADSISGERERASLEGLLLVPTSRRQIVVGKFLAAISPWPVALLRWRSVTH